MNFPGATCRRVAVVAAWFAACVPLCVNSTEVIAPPTTLTRSSSGQFLVSGKVLPPLRQPLAFATTNSQLIVLEPAFLTISCERIRSALLRELDYSERWTGPIYVGIYPAKTTNDAVYVRHGRRPGWQYQLEVPQLIDRKRFVTAVTHALLLEISNQTAAERSADIPLWLSEGFARQLLARNGSILILEAPRRTVNGLPVEALLESERREHPLKEAHATLLAQPALTFQELSWPAESQLTGAERERFAASAHLMVYELLALPNGRADFRVMLAQLPRYLNWQLAFLKGFEDQFKRPLDIEKWWALQTATFGGRELAQTWPRSEAHRKFDEILLAPIEIRTNSSAVPKRGETTLQMILREWPPTEQAEALRNKVAQLQALTLRVPPDLAVLAEAYRQTLGALLPAANREPKPLSRRRMEEAVKTLDQLDARRSALREPQEPTGPLASSAFSNNSQAVDNQ